MVLSGEAEKYRIEFAQTTERVGKAISSGAFASDLELIRAINKGMDELAMARRRHVRHD